MADGSAASTDVGSARGDTRIETLTASQRAIARRSAEARATIPDLELETEVDVGAALERCDADGWSLTAILVKACALALREVPRANGAYRDGHFELYSRVNVGVVVATDEAYVVPTVFDADLKHLALLTDELERLSAGARTGALPGSAFAGATFSLLDGGTHGITRPGIILSSGQAAAVAAGAVREAPLVREGKVVPGHLMTLTLTCDHRILYGTQAARLLGAIRSILEEVRVEPEDR